MQGTKIKVKQTQQGNKLKVRTVNKNKRKKLPKNFLYAKSGGPPLKEYKQSTAEQSKSSS